MERKNDYPIRFKIFLKSTQTKKFLKLIKTKRTIEK